ncbi:MAG: helix-turn-helix domain-containing protein [Rubrivivax sp.]|nr:helix-turn-helix domain-containing protein [Rubrivivax sp.]
MNKFAIGHGYTPQAAYTIAEFCDAHRISRTHLHNLMKAGHGPRIMKVGRRVLISPEAAADWRRQLEQETTPALCA